MKQIILRIAILISLVSCNGDAKRDADAADLIIVNGKVTLPGNDTAFDQAFAVKDGKILRVGSNKEILELAGDNTQTMDVKVKTVIPGLNDSQSHNVRGRRFFNSELRWDGVETLKRALEMLKEQADRTPEGQWVRVIGGWTPYQLLA